MATAGKSKKAPATKPRAKKAREPERWVPVPGYEGLYDVSNLGRVRSLPRLTCTGILGGRILAQDIGRQGYRRVTLSNRGEASRFLVHRLVLTAFKGASELETRHLNGVSSDNRLSNLAWGSRSENAADRVRHGTQYDNRGERHGNARLTDEGAKQIKLAVGSGRQQSEVAREFNVSAATVNRIARGNGWTHVGAINA